MVKKEITKNKAEVFTENQNQPKKDNKKTTDKKDKKKNNNTKIISGIVIIIVIIALAIVLTRTNVKSGNITISLNYTGGILYNLNNSEYYIKLDSINSSSKTAFIELVHTPVFTSTAEMIKLPIGTIVHINTSGKYTNLIIKSEAVSKSNVTLNIYPVSESLGIEPNTQYISSINCTQ